MANILKPDLCIIGGGSAGLSLAAGAAQMGADTVLVEEGRMGGDCLNYGCVPSKSLIACARAAHDARKAHELGVELSAPKIDMARVRQHINKVIATIEPHDSVERFEGLGVNVIQEQARFSDNGAVQAGDHKILARRFVIATGSRPAIPPIDGLDQVPHFTNETIFFTDEDIRHLLIVGAGPIGCELAQAFARLDVDVTLIDMASILPREDDDLRAIVRQHLLEDGVTIHEQATIQRVEPGPVIHLKTQDGERQVSGSHVMISTGRRPNIETLGLDRAGINVERTGIKVDRHLRTSNRRVFAIGDCNGLSAFTHAAGYQASVALKNILLRMPATVKPIMPRVTYTDPEIAWVGQSESELKHDGIEYEVVKSPFSGNDRAIADNRKDGFCKILVSPKWKGARCRTGRPPCR